MKLLTKFESKSTRAKGIAFHPSRPWVLVALFSSTIQLWDYRMGTLLHRFEDHDGPVRGIDFHPTQPLFVSAGDDYTIKVWSLETNKCLYTLEGHLDYVRTVFFHRELPWIISASDDQTIRIWNWQNRKEIACITGHNHFVMCAQFHPTEDLIVSASLDETVRVWDISKLREKHSAPGGANIPSTFEEKIAAQQNLLDGGFGDCTVKFILEGHTRGVNWASFHPTLPLIVSGGDDRQVKLWKMSATKAWELDSCRGHTNNVDSVIFHPTQNLIISVGEDKTLRIWDLDKRVPVKQFKRENDRFWLIAAHPNINLFGAAHDSGIMIFKLDRERPAFNIYQNNLFYVNNEKQLQTFDYNNKVSSLPYVSLKKLGETWVAFRSISYNPSQHSVLVNQGDDHYSLVVLPKQPTGPVDPTSVVDGDGLFAQFVARNRFATYNKKNNVIEIRSLDNKVTKSINIDSSVRDMAYGGPGMLLVLQAKAVTLLDVQQGKPVASIPLKNVKYISWSPDGQYLALISKHTISITNKKLQMVYTRHETIRVKSIAWDETNVLIYSTLNHIKYLLLNGDLGIIKTLEKTLYITRVQGKLLYTLNRDGEVQILSIDPTEYRFKKALTNGNYPEVMRIIKNSNLVGQNIISYLQKSGHPDVALQFVQDPQTRFDLSVEYGNLDVALTEAKKLDNSSTWTRLRTEAMTQGNIKIVELVDQTLRSFDQLSFLYLIGGERTKLSKMESVAQSRNDISSSILNSVYNNSITHRSNIFANAGSLPLAYAVAKANGDEDAAAAYLEQAGIDEQDVTLPDVMNPSNFVKEPVIQPMESWPLNEAELSYFEKAVLGQIEDLSLDEPVEDESVSRSHVQGEDAFFDDEDAAEGEDAWDMGDDDLDIDETSVIAPTAVEDQAAVVSTPGLDQETSIWVKNSKLPAVLAASGAFDAAGHALNKQVGIVNFEPLRKYFVEIYEGSRTYMISEPSELPSIQGHIRAFADEPQEAEILPYIPGVDVVTAKMNEGFKHFKANKLTEAIESFRSAIYHIVLLVVYNEEDEKFARSTLEKAREYILGLSIELARRALPEDDIKRNLELAAYFTKAKLAPAHHSNALQVAMSQNFKNKNFVQASYFAGKFLQIMDSGPRAEQAKKIKDKSDSLANDAVEIDFDPYAEFDICASSYTPIYKGEPSVQDPLTGAKYHSSEKDNIDKIALISKVGTPASGLRILI
ncbi:hypothetical protein TPHA_0D04500 [Tetrapisispora phaffii CBS 4417]|uniref:Coatomer subunit alpha n=1 Tax=Tetrapisispora phaffii (strain ATCC 24235 / CBS 4417 / NBRC 1672 / NRRL Y-8282 / UCD 70-5) TaxID=1071381 RepID=G8BS09_TETPH|nr:hypothetical protein TPHA_0D04500 [Tetrapisispora phaffii CBS 4417]CCE63084.1 hypothetical protein TPHA_0D04500 [Tetrapisispora phaffii CBS 4417]